MDERVIFKSRHHPASPHAAWFKDLLVVTLIAALWFTAFIGLRPLANPDEGAYTEIARYKALSAMRRRTDEGLAKRAIEWLGLDPENQDLVKELTEQTAPVTGKDGYVEPHRRGEGYMRDGSGNVGRIKTLLPATESRREAALTTPKDNKKLVKA